MLCGMRLLLSRFSWIFLPPLPVWAWYAHDPHFLPLCPWGVPLLIAICLALRLRARGLRGLKRTL